MAIIQERRNNGEQERREKETAEVATDVIATLFHLHTPNPWETPLLEREPYVQKMLRLFYKKIQKSKTAFG